MKIACAFDHAGFPLKPVVLETVRAGQRPTQPLAAHTAIRIMTGAPLPDGADTVIRVEDTDGGESHVVIRDAGAYGFTMACEYNGRPLAAEIFVSGGAVRSVSQSPGREAWVARRLSA